MRSSDIWALHHCSFCDSRFYGRWLHDDAAVAAAFRGYWRLISIHDLEPDQLDFFGPARLIFDNEQITSIHYGLVVCSQSRSVRYGICDSSYRAEFGWFGYENEDDACGHGWAVIDGERLIGEIHYHFEAFDMWATLQRGDNMFGRFIAVRPPLRGRARRRAKWRDNAGRFCAQPRRCV